MGNKNISQNSKHNGINLLKIIWYLVFSISFKDHFLQSHHRRLK